MSLQKLLVATNNPGKRREFQQLLAGLPYEALLPADLGLKMEVAETGETYVDNARLKAVAFAQASGLLTLGDDSGLEVAALGNAPGVYSARYAGEGASDADRRRKLLAELQTVPAPRPARFVCVIVLAAPDGRQWEFVGECPGEIIFEERGANGFGYDPIFYLPEHQCTMAELPAEVKNQISHRARAAQAAIEFLRTYVR